MNIWKIYLNFGERYKFMVDHHSYSHNLRSCKIKAWKTFRPERDSNPWPLRYRCSALPTELSSHLGAGHIVRSASGLSVKNGRQWVRLFVYHFNHFNLFRSFLSLHVAEFKKLLFSVYSSVYRTRIERKSMLKRCKLFSNHSLRLKIS